MGADVFSSVVFAQGRVSLPLDALDFELTFLLDAGAMSLLAVV